MSIRGEQTLMSYPCVAPYHHSDPTRLPPAALWLSGVTRGQSLTEEARALL